MRSRRMRKEVGEEQKSPDGASGGERGGGGGRGGSSHGYPSPSEMQQINFGLDSYCYGKLEIDSTARSQLHRAVRTTSPACSSSVVAPVCPPPVVRWSAPPAPPAARGRYSRVNRLKRQFKNLYVVVAVPTREQNESFNQSYHKLLSPLSAVPLVSLVGFGLYELGFPEVAKCVEIGLLELIHACILHSICLKCCILGSLSSAGLTQVHCRVDHSGLISGVPWIRVSYPFQWGAPTFDSGEAFAMMMTSFIILVESTGAFIAASRYASATMIPPSIISQGIGWQGINILLDSFFGTANGTSVSVENVGLLAFTNVGSRRVVQISAGFMIFFAILGNLLMTL
ncbi:hypothetical protein ABZP36_005930 [Zizania latifolia]